MSKISNCRLYPCRVREMQLGDRYGIDPGAIWADLEGNAHVNANAQVGQVRQDRAILKRRADGFYLNLAQVESSIRWARLPFWTIASVPVQAVIGAFCP